MKILVVDDEPEYRMLMKSLLALEKWDVSLAADGEEALQQMTKANFNLIISDVYMPVMDGITLLRKVREKPEYEKLPFLFVSAYDDEYTVEVVKNPKIERFLKKGRPIDELKGCIRYLTESEDRRPKLPPTLGPKLTLQDSSRRTTRRGTRTPII